MCFPIQFAATWPDRVENNLRPLDFSKSLRALEFEPPRTWRISRPWTLARAAGEAGGTLPAVLNAANEVAVAAFLDGQISFPRIWGVVEAAMNAHQHVAAPDLAAILAADADARRQAVALVG